jgi:sugar phosphate isomerase/epimerase
MKIGFSSLVCPGWDLQTMVSNASSMGFDGIELRGLRGELDLPRAPDLAAEPEQVKRLLQEQNVELVCLGTSATLDSHSRGEVARQKAAITDCIELASKLGCPYVRIGAGKVQRWDHQRAALTRIADALASMIPVASRYEVTLLVENGGDFPRSDSLWYLIDAVGHPAVRACWNQCHAMTAGERPTISIPRLGGKIGLVHVCDADFDARGMLLQYKPPGQGQINVVRQIELLKGMVYDRYLVFEWPKLWVESLPEPEAALPEVVKFLRECVEAKQAVLSAYKGDKRPPKFTSRPALQSRS